MAAIRTYIVALLALSLAAAIGWIVLVQDSSARGTQSDTDLTTEENSGRHSRETPYSAPELANARPLADQEQLYDEPVAAALSGRCSDCSDVAEALNFLKPKIAKMRSRAVMASVYSHKYHGRRTASGQRFDKHALTAAHRTLPFGTRVRVTNRSNKKSVIVQINDRGPFVKGRLIDLSPAAARSVDIHGIAQVSLSVLR